MQSLLEGNIKIEVVHDVPKISSLLLAENTGNEHKAIMQLIKKYSDRLEKKSCLTFEMEGKDLVLEKQKENSYYRAKKICYLDERQSTLLITFLKNTDEVVEFKDKIVEAFFMMKEKLENKIKPNQDITNLTSAVLEQTKMLSTMFEKFNGMEKEMIETRAVMQTIKRDMSVLPKMSDTNDELKKYLKKQPIDPDKIRIIRNAVTDRALELAKRHNIDSGICQRHIYTRIREIYKLSMYVELPSVHFDGCLKMIDKTTMNTYMTQPFEDIDDIALAEEIA